MAKLSFLPINPEECRFQQNNIPALTCLRFESQTGKKVPISYPANPGTIDEHLKRKRMDSKLLQKDVAKILGVTEDCITN